MSKEDLPILNMSQAPHKKLLVDYVKSLSGVYRFEFTRVRNQRSLAQLAYLFGVVYRESAKGIRECWGDDTFGILDAHEFFKDRFLSRDVYDRQTGEVKGKTRRSTGSLDVAEMSDYIENIILFAAEQLGVSVPPAAQYDEIPKRKTA